MESGNQGKLLRSRKYYDKIWIISGAIFFWVLQTKNKESFYSKTGIIRLVLTQKLSCFVSEAYSVSERNTEVKRDFVEKRFSTIAENLEIFSACDYVYYPVRS